MRTIPLLSGMIILLACGDGKQEAAQALAAADTIISTSLSVDLNAQDMPLFVELGPADLLGIDAPTVRWNEEMGRMEVDGGEHFGIVITEETGDLPRLKADLERDMLQKHTVIEEAPDRLVYRSQFPDDGLVFVHFYQVVQSGGRWFTVQDNEKGRFNEADVARMAKAVRTQRTV